MDTTTLLNELSQLVRLTDNLSQLSADKLQDIYAAVQELMRESEGYLVRATTAEAQVTALLSSIYEDDGATQAQVGTARAVKEALTTLQAGHGNLEHAEEQLGSLLARIHGDGGHYQGEHGTDKAVTDADALICAMRQQLDSEDDESGEM